MADLPEFLWQIRHMGASKNKVANLRSNACETHEIYDSTGRISDFSKIVSFVALGMILVPDERPGFELSLFCNRVAPIIFLSWQMPHFVKLSSKQKRWILFLFEFIRAS